MVKQADAHRRLVREWIIAGALGIALALGAGTALRTFVLGAVVVPSRSMCNTVMPGDRVLVSKLIVPRSVTITLPFTDLAGSFTIPPVRRIRVGDVLVVRPPEGWIENRTGRSAYLVKRCAGLPGDTLVFDSDMLRVNGFFFRLPDAAIQREHPRVYREGGIKDTVVVPAEKCFLLGDNPGESVDSRTRGPVSMSSIVGVASVVYWSVDPADDGSGRGVVRWERIGKVVR
jgi:signal peptidase I